MITNEAQERVRGWFVGRLPEEWRSTPPEVTVDRDAFPREIAAPLATLLERALRRDASERFDTADGTQPQGASDALLPPVMHTAD